MFSSHIEVYAPALRVFDFPAAATGRRGAGVVATFVCSARIVARNVLQADVIAARKAFSGAVRAAEARLAARAVVLVFIEGDSPLQASMRRAAAERQASVYNSRMDGAELYAMLIEELDAEGIQAREWQALADRAQLAWQKLARRLEREQRGQQMLSAYPD